MYHWGPIGMTHLRFWAQAVMGLGYAILLIGTVGSIAFVVVGDSGSEFSTSIGVIGLLGSWLVCSPLILFSSYIMWRTDVLELEENRVNDADESAGQLTD